MCKNLPSPMYFWQHLQDGNNVTNAEISKRERARLKEMQKMKRQKIQEILDVQNAAIEADMVCASYRGFVLLCVIYSPLNMIGGFVDFNFNCRTIGGRGA
jgi:hypothetical protein